MCKKTQQEVGCALVVKLRNCASACAEAEVRSYFVDLHLGFICLVATLNFNFCFHPLSAGHSIWSSFYLSADETLPSIERRIDI